MRKNKVPFASVKDMFIASSSLAFSLMMMPCYANNQYLHTRDSSGITNLLESSFYGDSDTHMGTVYTSPGVPCDQYNFAAFNLGNVPNVVAGWPIKNKTGYDAPSPFYIYKSQVCEINAPGTDKTALQAYDKAWGGYMKSTDWTGSGNRMSLRYSYKFSSPPAVFSSSVYNSAACLVVAANIGVTRYEGGGSSATVGPVGWCVVNMILEDQSSGQQFTLIVQVFDPRGFKTYDGTHAIGAGLSRERVGFVTSGEMVAVTYFGPGTKYCTRLTNSPYSQTAVMTNCPMFGYVVSRAQLLSQIVDVNNYLTTYYPSETRYSTNPNDYVLREASVGVEASRIPTGTDPEFSMSYIGNVFNVYTSY